MQYTEKELTKLISDLETEFTAHLAKAEFGAAQPTLAKAEDEKPEEESKDEAPENKESKPEAESKEEKPEEKPEHKEEAPKQEAKEEAPVAPSADEGASGYDAEDIAHMDQMYMSMSKAELLAHHDSCVRALDAQGAEHVHAPQQAPEAQQPQQEIDKCGDMSIQKTENVELELAKSEAAAAKAKAEELEKSMAGIQKFLTEFVKKTPQGKAITSLEQISKTEVLKEEKVLSKSEISQILTRKAQDPSLTKTDRDAINAYYLNQTDLKTINHLLK